MQRGLGKNVENAAKSEFQTRLCEFQKCDSNFHRQLRKLINSAKSLQSHRIRTLLVRKNAIWGIPFHLSMVTRTKKLRDR